MKKDVHDILAAIRNQGLRLTSPRKGIIKVLHESDEYLSVDEIFDRVSTEDPGIGLATIYRTLIMLSEIGVVTKFEFGEGKARYELAESDDSNIHHHVLVCTNCQDVIKYSDFSPEEKQGMEKNEEYLEEKYNFTISRHVVQYYGICAECMNRMENQ